jgi:hypothetical protein
VTGNSRETGRADGDGGSPGQPSVAFAEDQVNNLSVLHDNHPRTVPQEERIFALGRNLSAAYIPRYSNDDILFFADEGGSWCLASAGTGEGVLPLR